MLALARAVQALLQWVKLNLKQRGLGILLALRRPWINQPATEQGRWLMSMQA
jgi:hypothetical protein